MGVTEKLKEVFLIFDKGGHGKLDKPTAVTAFNSIGFVLSHDDQEKLGDVDLNGFLAFGEQLAKAKSPAARVQEVINNATTHAKVIRTGDFEHIATAISNLHVSKFREFLATVDPNNTGVVTPASLLAQLSG